MITRRLTAWQTFVDQPTKVIPDLATDIGKSSNGGKTWTYKLKDGIKFQTGAEITSQDIKYGIERSFAPELSGGLGYHKTLLVGGSQYKGPYSGASLDSIEVPDAKTIVFNLNQPYADWPWIAAQPAFSPVPQSADSNPQQYSPFIVASGPYQVADYQSGTQLRLVKNQYWDKSTDTARTGQPNSIVFQLSQDLSTSSQMVAEDIGPAAASFVADPVPPPQQVQIRTSAANRLFTSRSGALQYLALNVQSPALRNPQVREAFQYAVDKKAFRVASGGATAGDYATTLITEGIAGRQNFDLYPTDENGDPAKAKQLLQAGGYNGQNLLLLAQNDPTWVVQAEAIVYGLSNAGINVTIKTLDQTTFTGIVTGNDATAYDLALTSWQADYPSANANIEPLFASSQIGNGGMNVSRYSNPSIDQQIVTAQGTLDPKVADPMWTAIDKAILADSPVVPLIFAARSFIAGSDVQNFQISEFPGYPNYLEVTLAP